MMVRTRYFKRCLAMVLVVAMLLTMPNVAWAVGTPGSAEGSRVTVTDGQLVSFNYEGLTSQEIAVLSSTALAGNRYSFDVPSNEGGLIDVDPDTRTISAKPFETEGYIWNPMSAAVIYEGGQEEIELQEGQGLFTYEGISYRVEVLYGISISGVDTALQGLLINTPHYLAQGVRNLAALRESLDGLSLLAQNIDAFYSLTDSSLNQYGVTLSSEETKNAIRNLYNQVQTNGSGTFDLAVLYRNYNTVSPLEYLYAQGANIKSKAVETYTEVKAICEDEGIKTIINTLSSVDPTLSSRLNVAINILKTYLGIMQPAVEDPWTALEVPQVLKDGITSAEYAELSNLAAAASGYTNLHDNVAFSDTLLAAQNTLTYDMNQYNVTVTVSAYAIPQDQIDSAQTVLQEQCKVNLVLRGGTTADEVIEAVKKSGVEKEALETWDGFYEIGLEHYERQVTLLDAVLSSNVAYDITYIPKEYSVHYEYDTDEPASVPYGYNLTLPLHEDSEQAYDYIVNGKMHDQGEIYRVTEETEIARSEGKSKADYRLLDVVADNYKDVLSEESLAVMKNAALNSPVLKLRVPADGDALLTLRDEGNGNYNVAASDYPSGLPEVVWRPVSGEVKTNDGNTVSTFTFSGNEADFSATVFDHVEVRYELTASTVEAGTAASLLNLPDVLSQEAKAQKDDMQVLLAQYTRLGRLNQETLNQINAVVRGSELTEESKAAIKLLIEKCVDAPTASLHLYNYLTQYKASGIAYYYQNNNYVKIKEQVGILNQYLEQIYNDPAFYPLLVEIAYDEYYEEIGDIVEAFQQVTLSAPNSAINTSSPSVTALAAAIEASLGHTSSFPTEAVTRPLVLSAIVAQGAPDKVAITVNVKVVNSSGEKIAEETGSLSFTKSVPLTKDDVDALNALRVSLEERAGVDAQHYTSTGEMPEEGTELKNSRTVNFVWSPKQYTVSFRVPDGEEAPEGQSFYFDTPTITLAACEQAGKQYRYTIGEEKIDVGAEDVVYSFTQAQIDSYFTEGMLEVTRETVDLYRQYILQMVSDFNKAMAAQGLTFEKDGKNCLVAAFIPAEDADGNLSVTLRIAPQAQQIDAASLVQEIAKVILGTNLSYIGIDGQPVKADSMIHLQTLVDALLNSDTGLATISNLISENGDIVEADLSGIGTVIGATDGMIVVSDGKYINDVDVLGGKLMETELQLGLTAEDAWNVPFYITMEDFDLSASALKKLRKNIADVQNYLDVSFKDGQMNMTLTVPEKIYPGYLSAMLLLDQANLENINGIDLGEMLGYDIELIKPLLKRDDVTIVTLENTLRRLGREKDLSAYAKAYETARKILNHIAENAQVQDDTTTDGVYTGRLNYGLQGLFDIAHISGQLASSIVEKDTGLNVPFGVTMTNFNDTYQAMVLDKNASGAGKVRYAVDAGEAVASAPAGAIVVLLDNVSGNLNFTNTATLNLNGKTVDGNVSAGAELSIVDSVLDTYRSGSVTGSVSGAVTVSAGQYAQDMSDMLDAGCRQDENGYVLNQMYTIAVNDENGNINVSLDAAFLSMADTAGLKTMAKDLAYDLVFNYYTSASMTLDGNEIYRIELDDALSMMNGGVSEIVTQVLNSVNVENVSAFANQVLNDLTDFNSMKAAVESGASLAEYRLETAPWQVEFDVAGEGAEGYLTANVTAGESSEQGRIHITVGGSEEEKNALAELCGALADITSINALSVKLDSIQYVNGSLKLSGGGMADVRLDLTGTPEATNADYAAVLAVVLANGLGEDENQALVDGLKVYAANGIASGLKTAIEEVTTKQLLDSLKVARGISFDEMLLALDIAKEDLPGSAALEKTYSDLLNAVYAVVARMPVTGSGTKLGAAAVEGEYGTYRYSGVKKNVEFTLTIELFDKTTVEPKIIVTAGDGVTVRYSGSNLAAAFAAAGDGSTIAVKEAVTLEENLAINGTVVITGADKVNWNGKTVTLGAAAHVTADHLIGAEKFTAGAPYYEVAETQEGTDYHYVLKALQPEFVDEKPKVNLGQVIRGSKADADNKLLYLDVSPAGITEEQFKALVSFAVSNAEQAYSFEDCAAYEGRSLLATGTKVTVTASNTAAAETVELTYTIIIMGDTNCNGRTDSGDAVLMSKHYQSQDDSDKMNGYPLLAADMNQNGEVESGDAVKNATKYKYMWADNTYLSALK